jgi:hypothetical protein
MDVNSLPQLSGRRLRVSSNFKMVATAELNPLEKQKLGLSDVTDLDTILLPVVSHLSAKAICRNTRILLETMPASSQASHEYADALNVDPVLIVRLVLDSVLEIEQADRFVCGCAAYRIFWPGLEIEAFESEASSRISLDALRYADALTTLDAPTLSTRLYLYNRIPLSPNWVSRFGHSTGLDSLVGFEAGELSRAWCMRGWNEVRQPNSRSWRVFSLDGFRRGGQFKLYINPRTDCLRETIETVLPILREHEFGAFKLGSNLQTLLRPDKFVAYASSKEQIDSASRAILTGLSGVPVQALPFTASIDADGLLTWGIDPPCDKGLSGWHGASWRRWITDRLAATLFSAREEGALDSVLAALTRLSLDGIDTRTWKPENLAWEGTYAQ